MKFTIAVIILNRIYNIFVKIHVLYYNIINSIRLQSFFRIT